MHVLPAFVKFTNKCLGKITDVIDLNFWSRVNFEGPVVKPELGPCWLWTRATDKRFGYGIYGAPTLQGRGFKTILAHRYAYIQFFGDPINENLDHLCRTEKCVNPWHLDDVTHKENVLRGIGPTAINSRKNSCPKGHEYESRSDNKGRYCRTCANINRVLNRGSVPRTHCKKGHILFQTPLHHKKQQKYCPVCRKAGKIRRKERLTCLNMR